MCRNRTLHGSWVSSCLLRPMLVVLCLHPTPVTSAGAGDDQGQQCGRREASAPSVPCSDAPAFHSRGSRAAGLGSRCSPGALCLISSQTCRDKLKCPTEPTAALWWLLGRTTRVGTGQTNLHTSTQEAHLEFTFSPAGWCCPWVGCLQAALGNGCLLLKHLWDLSPALVCGLNCAQDFEPNSPEMLFF